jgi:hypothetical protein
MLLRLQLLLCQLQLGLVSFKHLSKLTLHQLFLEPIFLTLIFRQLERLLLPRQYVLLHRQLAFLQLPIQQLFYLVLLIKDVLPQQRPLLLLYVFLRPIFPPQVLLPQLHRPLLTLLPIWHQFNLMELILQ